MSRKRSLARGGRARAGVHLDGGVAAAAAILSALGIVMIYSATAPLALGSAVPPHLVRHLAAVAAALACLVIAVRTPLAVWQRLALPLWGAGVVLLLATALLGVEVNGARRWLAIPGVPWRLQAAELAKWATLLAVATVLAGRPATGRRPLRERLTGRKRRGAAPPEAAVRRAFGLALLPALLLLLQPDFGSAAVLLLLTGLLVFAAGAPLRLLVLPGAIGALGAVSYVALRPYALDRWTGFLDPWRNAHDQGFQLVQSFVAFGRGGTLGVGLGDGRQKLFYLPEAHTDFILSVVAEELGLVGVLVVLGAFSALVWAGLRIAGRARDPFCLLVAFGMTAFIAVPAAVNAAVVMGLLPTTGFPLPFLSLGGNSLLFCGLAIGILLRCGAHEAAPARRRVGVAVPRGLLGA